MIYFCSQQLLLLITYMCKLDHVQTSHLLYTNNTALSLFFFYIFGHFYTFVLAYNILCL